MTEDINRRDFLKKSIFLLGGLITAGIALPASVYVLSPIWKKVETLWVEVADIHDIPLGLPVKLDFIQRKKDGWVTIEGRTSAWVVTADGKQFTAFDPRCTHLGCPYRFDAEKKQFLCPCHAGVFGMDGEVLAGPPPRGLDRFPTKVEGGKLWVFVAPVKKEA